MQSSITFCFWMFRFSQQWLWFVRSLDDYFSLPFGRPTTLWLRKNRSYGEGYTRSKWDAPNTQLWHISIWQTHSNRNACHIHANAMVNHISALFLWRRTIMLITIHRLRVSVDTRKDSLCFGVRTDDKGDSHNSVRLSLRTHTQHKICTDLNSAECRWVTHETKCDNSNYQVPCLLHADTTICRCLRCLYSTLVLSLCLSFLFRCTHNPNTFELEQHLHLCTFSQCRLFVVFVFLFWRSFFNSTKNYVSSVLLSWILSKIQIRSLLLLLLWCCLCCRFSLNLIKLLFFPHYRQSNQTITKNRLFVSQNTWFDDTFSADIIAIFRIHVSITSDNLSYEDDGLLLPASISLSPADATHETKIVNLCVFSDPYFCCRFD